ncbi:MAG: sugar phosphate isomerase/epimerase family protein [Clostridia bacterium]
MKISCLPVSLFDEICSGKMDILDWAREAKTMGYDGIDISMMFLKNKTPYYIRTLKEGLQELEMPIAMMTTYPDFTHPDPVQRERELLYLLAEIAFCSQMDIKYLRILAGQDHYGVDYKQSVANVIEYFKRSAEYADKFGVELLYEDHAKPGAWDIIDFSYDPKIFLEIYEGIKETSIGINFDTGNISAFGDDPMEILKKLDVAKIKTIHVTDMKQVGVFDPCVIGQGVTDNPAVFKYIKERGFDGWLCIEEASNCGLEGIKKAHDYVQEIWNNA